MELIEYSIEAPKPRKPMGSLGADLQHMLIGMFSEFNELADALGRRDKVNILEELGDFSWYVVNHADLRGFTLVLKDSAIEPYTIKDLLYHSSQLANTIKRTVIYGKTEENLLSLEGASLQHVFDCLCNFRDVEGTGIYDIKDAWRRNINKLTKGKNARYKDGKYSDEAALNRDEAAERKELEK
jgi:hypothetical protein